MISHGNSTPEVTFPRFHQKWSFQGREGVSYASAQYNLQDYTFTSGHEIKMGAVMVTRQFNQIIQQRTTMSQLTEVLSQASSQASSPCFLGDNQNACSFEKVKPWFFKPRKSKYGLEDSSKKTKKFNSLHWTEEENRRYVQFLKGFLELINGDILRKRKYHLNRMLSKHIGSRSPIQCRSHHQKMIKTYGTPEAIISHFQATPLLHLHNPNHLVDSPTPMVSENSPFPTLESLTTHTDSKIEEENQKEKYQRQDGYHFEDEAMLWDVLTYPLIEDSFNDL